MRTVLSVLDLSFKYPEYSSLKTDTLYKNLSFTVNEGDIAVFLAPPETGKTTLSRIITSLVPGYTGGKLSGKVRLLDMDVQKEKPYNLNSKAGLVFQNPEEQILTPLVESEISFALESKGLDYNEIEKKVEKALKFIGIESLKGKNPAFLSGGEKRKLLVSCLAAFDPVLWILDETLEEIDPESRLNILEKLKKSKKTVFILTSKMLDIYKKYCSRFFLYYNGELFTDKAPPGGSFMEKALEAGVFLKHENMEYPCLQSRSGKNSSRKNILLKAKNIEYSYPGGSFLLSVDNFELAEGEVTVLLGHNGSGKSTFSKILAGLIKPDSGSIYLTAEQEAKSCPAALSDLNKNTAYLFQNPDYQLFLPTVMDELSFGLKLEKMNKKRILEKAGRAMELFGLDKPDIPPALMSYGARKRLQAAIYYLLEKKIIIIDEADSGLSFNDFSSLLDKLNSSPVSHTILVITHDVKLASKTADRIVIMKEGRIIKENPEKEFSRLVNLTF